ncbi:MAG: hypothetical protein ACRD1X_10420 [Vicinamibacteria bacterium]
MRRSAPSLGILLLLVGCAHTSASSAAIEPQVRIVRERHETRVDLMQDCLVFPTPRERYLGAIGVALTPLLIDGALSAVQNFLNAREAALAGAHSAHTSGRFYDSDGELGFGCIVVVRGTFGQRHEEIGDQDQRGSVTGKHLTDLGLADFPDFYFEARASLEPSGDEESAAIMRVTPQVLQLARTAAARSGAGAKTTNLLFLFSRAALDPTEDPDKDAAFAVLPFQFEQVPIGAEISKDSQGKSLLEHHSVTTGIPASAIEGSQFVIPFNIAVYVEETEQAGAFQKLILDVFARKKNDFETKITEIVTGALQPKKDEP